MQIHRGVGSAAAALGIVGTGLALALPEEKWIGWVLVALGAFVFLFDIRIEGWQLKIGRGADRLHAMGPWALIIGGPLVGFLWLYYGQRADRELPGFTSFAVVRLYDSPEFIRRHVFEVGSDEKAKISFYLSASSLFTLSVTDVRGEPYSVEVQAGRKGIPIDEFVVLFCEVGITKTESILRVLVNDREVARRVYSFPINLGKMEWKPLTLGTMHTEHASPGGNLPSAPFAISELAFYSKMLAESDRWKLLQYARSQFDQPFD